MSTYNEMKKYKALVIANSIGQAEQLNRHLMGKPYYDIEFRYPGNISYQTQDLHQIYKDCCDTIIEEEIDIVINVDPGMDFVQAALAQKFSHLRTPTMESLFLCTHSYYNRNIITHEFSDDYWLIDFTDDIRQQVESVFKEGDQSYFMFQSCYRYIPQSKKIKCVKSFIRDVETLQNRVWAGNSWLRFIQKFLDTDIYEHATKPCGMMYVDSSADYKTSTVHTVELCISDGVIIPWVISDHFYWKCNRKISKCVSIPSKIDALVKVEIWATIREVIQKIVGYGYDNHFMSIKLVVQDKLRVKFLEMNNSIIKENTLMYRHVYRNGDNLGALIDLTLDRLVDHPMLNSNRHAIRAQLITFRSDPEPVNISEVVNVNYMRKHDQVISHIRDHTAIVHDRIRGCHLADVLGFGTSYKECEDQVEEICRNIVQDTRSSHWTHCLHR